MVDVVKTCANCGNTQTTGDFCEKCGTRMPAAAPVVPAAAAAAAAYSAPRPSTPPPVASPGYTPQPSQYGAAPPRYDYAGNRGFFSRLFDFSFKDFITPSIIKVLFVISIIVIGLGVLGGIIFGFMGSVGTGFIFLIGGLIYGFLALLYIRVMLEMFIVFFRIYDNTDEIAKSKR